MTKIFLLLVSICLAGNSFADPAGIGLGKGRGRINKLFVISIGVSYEGNHQTTQSDSSIYALNNCKVCLTDATGVPEYFKALRKKVNSIDTVISWTFANSLVSYDALEDAFFKIQQSSRADDVFVFYYAGISWGIRFDAERKSRESYYNLEPGATLYNSNTSFTLEKLKKLTDRIAAKRQLIIFDTGDGKPIQDDFYRNFFSDNPAEAMFTQKERIVLCPENLSSETLDSAGVRKGDMFKIISDLPAQFNVFKLFEHKPTGGQLDKNQAYKQFMKHWYEQQLNTATQVKLLREQDYLTMLTSIKSTLPDGKRGNIVLKKPSKEDSSMASRKKIALVISTSSYQFPSSWPALRNAENDGEAFSAAIKKLGYEVRPLVNSSKNQIMDAVSKLSDEASNPFDQVLIYFAGHGYYYQKRDKGYGYIVCAASKPIGTEGKPTDAELETYIDYTVLFRKLEELNKVVLITDVCFGGTSMNSMLQSNQLTSPINEDSKKRNPYRRVMSSGVSTVDDFIRMHNGTASPNSPFATELMKILAIGGSLSFDKIFAEIALKPLPASPIEFYFGDNVKPNEFIF